MGGLLQKRLTALAAILLTAIAVMTIYIVYALGAPPAAEAVRISIPAGSHSGAIAGLLEDHGLIRSQRFFRYYLKYKREGDRFQAGIYDFTPGMTKDELIAKLNAGDTVKEETVKFTIPEGYTIRQMADKLEQEGLASKAEFVQLADSREWTDKWTPQIPDSAYRHRLEGYLFAETYEMKKGSTAKEIVFRMLEETDKKTGQLPPDWQDKLQARGMSFHQMLTVASMIEREVAVDEERQIVAGVIYNRLAKGMPLQIDATIQYLFERSKDRMLEKDLQIESPYNTYLNPGLPPGPIASPGLLSIKAAIYPQETLYQFYVTKKDGSGGHLFAETYEEHKANIAKSKAGGS